MSQNFLNTNYSFIVNNNSDCGEVSDIKPALINSNNSNPLKISTLPIFKHGTNLFTSTGTLWCMNSENQSKCIPDDNYILKPTGNINIDSTFVDVNTFNYSNNILNNPKHNKLNIGKKINSTGTNVNIPNNYITIETSGNAYPFNSDFTDDGIKYSELNTMYLKSLKQCNNKSIENRFRPVYIHLPEKFLEVCEPVPYQSKNDAKII